MGRVSSVADIERRCFASVRNTRLKRPLSYSTSKSHVGNTSTTPSSSGNTGGAGGAGGNTGGSSSSSSRAGISRSRARIMRSSSAIRGGGSGGASGNSGAAATGGGAGSGSGSRIGPPGVIMSGSSGSSSRPIVSVPPPFVPEDLISQVRTIPGDIDWPSISPSGSFAWPSFRPAADVSKCL
jgi:hypothetical protein